MFIEKFNYINADDLIVELSVAFHALRVKVEELEDTVEYLLTILEDKEESDD